MQNNALKLIGLGDHSLKFREDKLPGKMMIKNRQHGLGPVRQVWV